MCQNGDHQTKKGVNTLASKETMAAMSGFTDLFMQDLALENRFWPNTRMFREQRFGSTT